MTRDARIVVAATARAASAAGLVEAFGHVSARTDRGFVITSVRPMGSCTLGDVVEVDDEGRPLAGPGEDLPLETPMHAAIYAHRPEVGAICRGHPRAAVAWGTTLAAVPLLHGLGAMAGTDPVQVHPDPQLVTTTEAADGVVRTLGTAVAVLLQANGALAVGATPSEAATRLHFLEERCAVALRRPRSPGGEIPAADWERRSRHSPAELSRAVAWFESTFVSRHDDVTRSERRSALGEDGT